MTITTPDQLAGWNKWDAHEPYEDMAGPFFFKKTANGYVSAFQVEPKHLNGGGAIHGGMLMTFADYSLFTIAYEELENGGGVTIALNGEFTAAGPASGIMYASGEVIRETGSMVFVRGVITPGDPKSDTVLLSFSGIVRKFKKRN
jgi:acyl-coenzyme A thioesterase PaaI-like protein